PRASVLCALGRDTRRLLLQIGGELDQRSRIEHPCGARSTLRRRRRAEDLRLHSKPRLLGGTQCDRRRGGAAALRVTGAARTDAQGQQHAKAAPHARVPRHLVTPSLDTGGGARVAVSVSSGPSSGRRSASSRVASASWAVRTASSTCSSASVCATRAATSSVRSLAPASKPRAVWA